MVLKNVRTSKLGEDRGRDANGGNDDDGVSVCGSEDHVMSGKRRPAASNWMELNVT